MKIKFTEDVTLALSERIGGRPRIKKRFRSGDLCDVEFLGEDNDANGMSFVMENGAIAAGVPLHLVEVLTKPKGQTVSRCSSLHGEGL
jgi:hypothetical protein